MYNFTIVWELIGGDVMVDRVQIAKPGADLTESDVLAALGMDSPDDVAILATFPGHSFNQWGAAIDEH